jgi:hypothetical protein
MNHQSRCMFALHMRRLVPYPDDAILRDSRFPECSSSFVPFEDLLRQALEQRIDPQLLPTGPIKSPDGRRSETGI